MPSAIVGFYTENDEPRSAVLAAAGSSSVYIFKNMRPYFKYCLPSLIANQEEQDVRKLFKSFFCFHFFFFYLKLKFTDLA